MTLRYSNSGFNQGAIVNTIQNLLNDLPDGNTTQVTMTHNEGWNLIGLPLDVNNSNYSTLFPDAWDGTLYHYGDTYTQESNLDPGKGYWLKFSDYGSNVISGTPIESLTLSLNAGWNMISGISTTVPFNDISDPGNILIDGTLYEYNTQYINASALTSGKGYWIRAYSSGSVSFSGLGQAKVSENFQLTNLNANTLIFSNNKGLTASLFVGTSLMENEMLSYSLPPLPPAGGFDVRFSGNMKLAENGGEILVQNESWPLKVTWEPVAGDWYLVNELNGMEYALNESGSIKITESTERLTLHKRTLTPEHFSLNQNYPNPFNPVTTIGFNLPEDSDVTLTVYDLSGREVAELVTGRMATGSHSVRWDAVDASSGVYIYQLTTETTQLTKKLLLLK